MSFSEGKADETLTEEPKGKVEQNPATGEARIIPNPTPNEDTRECKICGEEVSSPEDLEEHMKSHEVRRGSS
jgi:hypothetical protein